MSNDIIGRSDVDCAYQLGANERKSYKRDFTNELVDANGSVIASIVSAEWSVEPDDGQIKLTNEFIQDPIVGVYVETPTVGTYYRVCVTVTTSLTERFEKVIGIAGIQISGEEQV